MEHEYDQSVQVVRTDTQGNDKHINIEFVRSPRHLRISDKDDHRDSMSALASGIDALTNVWDSGKWTTMYHHSHLFTHADSVHHTDKGHTCALAPRDRHVCSTPIARPHEYTHCHATPVAAQRSCGSMLITVTNNRVCPGESVASARSEVSRESSCDYHLAHHNGAFSLDRSLEQSKRSGWTSE